MSDRKKKLYFPAAKGILFLLTFLLLFHGATELFRTKEFAYSVGPIYDLPRDSVDVIFLGSSHMNTVISPMDLWKDYGITSFNAAIGDQTIPASYFELRELLKAQRPKLVVLETYYIFQPEMMTASGEERLHWLVDNIPMSAGVGEAIQTLIREESDKTEYYLNFYAFHNRWKELTRTDFRPVECNNMGADMALYNVWSEQQAPVVLPEDAVQEPPELAVEYLHKVIDLCRQNDISLLLMASPCCAEETVQRQLNFAGQIAAAEEIPYLNFFHLLDEIGFQFAQDMAEESHMNYRGVQKVTAYVGDYIQRTYALEDRRSSPEAAAWWTEYARFSKILANTLLPGAANAEELFARINGQDYILALHAYSETPLNGTRLGEILQRYGIQTRLPEDANYYGALLQNGRILSEVASGEPIDLEHMAEDVCFAFGGGPFGSANPIAIHVGRSEYAKGTAGLNLAVYDPLTETVVDSVNINLETMECVQ